MPVQFVFKQLSRRYFIGPPTSRKIRSQLNRDTVQVNPKLCAMSVQRQGSPSYAGDCLRIAAIRVGEIRPFWRVDFAFSRALRPGTPVQGFASILRATPKFLAIFERILQAAQNMSGPVVLPRLGVQGEYPMSVNSSPMRSPETGRPPTLLRRTDGQVSNISAEREL